MTEPVGAAEPSPEPQIQPRITPRIQHCEDLDAAVAEHTGDGYRLVAIGPADEPDWAELERNDERVILDAAPAADADRYLKPLRIPETIATLTISHETTTGWSDGRAGMAYRDLIPDRWGGTYIASHINIARGGPVPDYVHHHDVAHQLIYVHRGWVRVVYQDQGPSFVMAPGDCVLQPPGIRHQVLEASDELYVTEVSCPATHRTSVDHEMPLPNGVTDPTAVYGGGQHFVRHVRTQASWTALPDDGLEAQVTEIGASTNGLAEVRFIRRTPSHPVQGDFSLRHHRDLLFLFMVSGTATLTDGADRLDQLREGSSVALPPGRDLDLVEASDDMELLELKCRRP